MTFVCLFVFLCSGIKRSERTRKKRQENKRKNGEAMALRKPECEFEHLGQVPRVPYQLQTEETVLPRKLCKCIPHVVLDFVTLSM